MKTIQLTRGQVAFVDDADYEALRPRRWQAHRRRNGLFDVVTHKRAVRSKVGWKSESVTMSELLLGRKAGYTVDHRDGNPLNNTRDNLRWATLEEQCRNRMKPNKLGMKGVFINGGGFAARITVSKKRIYLGQFSSLKEAAQAYNSAAKIHFGEFARLNPL